MTELTETKAVTATNRTLDPGVSTKVNSQTHVGVGVGVGLGSLQEPRL